jgi:hypothetical protein
MTEAHTPSATVLADAEPSRGVVITTLGLTQIFAWGSSYYLLAVLAKPIAADTGWPLSLVVGGVSLGLLAAGTISPRVGRAIDRHGGRPVLGASSVHRDDWDRQHGCALKGSGRGGSEPRLTCLLFGASCCVDHVF